MEKQGPARLTVPDAAWKQIFRATVMKDLEYKYICIYTYKTKASHKKCIVGVQVLY